MDEDQGGSLPGRWVNSHDLREGDVIFLKGRGPVTLRRVVQRHEQMPVCNLTVEELHTFAVGEMQVLVHNTSGTLPKPIRTTDAGPVFRNFNDAQANASAWLRERGFDPTKAQPNISKFTGEVNGLKMDGNIGFRIEFDARNGAHINVFAGKEKGPHFLIENVNEAGLNAILCQLFGGRLGRSRRRIMSQQDWLESLASEVASGQITVHENDTPWFDNLSRRFPVRASGICWEQIPNSQFRQAEQPRIPIAEKEGEIREFLMQFGSVVALTPTDRCVVIGDNTTSAALEMNFRVLLDVIPKLLTEPQSLYVIAKDGDWCFAFTFEEDMYFARSHA